MWEVNLLAYIFVILLQGEKVLRISCASCEENSLIQFLASLQVVSPENIFSLAIEEFDTVCSKLEDGLKRIEKSYISCKSQTPENLYVSLIAGLFALNDKICCSDTGVFRQFNLCRPCLYELRRDFEGCIGPADWTEETDHEKLCKTYKNIVDCYYIKVAKVCGKDAALMTTDLVIAVTEKIVAHSCKHINRFPLVKDIMPDKYIYKANSSQVLIPMAALILGSLLYMVLF